MELLFSLASRSEFSRFGLVLFRLLVLLPRVMAPWLGLSSPAFLFSKKTRAKSDPMPFSRFEKEGEKIIGIESDFTITQVVPVGQRFGPLELEALEGVLQLLRLLGRRVRGRFEDGEDVLLLLGHVLVLEMGDLRRDELPVATETHFFWASNLEKSCVWRLAQVFRGSEISRSLRSAVASRFN